jgi:hypothetical protein
MNTKLRIIFNKYKSKNKIDSWLRGKLKNIKYKIPFLQILIHHFILIIFLRKRNNEL